jgi:lipoprotein-anchoring transpeptidase ErfK/SrfK
MNRITLFLTVLLLLFTFVFSIGISGCTSRDNLSEQVLVQGVASAASSKPFPRPTASSEPTASPTPIATPAPTSSHVPSASPASTSAVPSVSPVPAASPAPSENPAPSQRPAVTTSPAPTMTASPKPFPRPSAIPEPTVTPAPTPTPTPTPAPTAVAAPAYRLEVDVTNQVVSAYEKDENGNYTKLVRQMICSTGKPSTPTPLGTYTLPGGKYDRGVWGYFSKFHVWARYFVRIKGGYLFHSVIYAKNDVKTLKQSTVNALGTPVSAGCIRLHVEDAKWIYDNAKPGTIVDIVKKEKNPELTAALKAGKPAPTPEPPEAVSVSLVVDKQEKLEIAVGETVSFKTMVTYSDKTEKDETANAEYSLDKAGIAVINNNTIQGISPGTTTMTVQFNGVTASIDILVTEAAPPDGAPGSSDESKHTPSGNPGVPAEGTLGEETSGASAGTLDAPAESLDVP